MKIIEQNIVIEITKAVEKTSTPYRITRRIRLGEIIWYGIYKNWICNSDIWYELINGKFVECVEPEYEKLYNDLRNSRLSAKH